MISRITLAFLAGASSFALVSTAAFAQNAEAPASVDTIVVTGSRVATKATQAPTPVTTVSSDQLRDTAPSIVGGLQQLPQLGTSTGATTPSLINGSGAATVSAENLRNLGVNRTLVLLDGRRTQPGGSGGYTDTSMFPDLLIKNVDIVTGGASAVYGSDAVSGVINFILDTNFTGVKVQSQGGLSTHGDAPLYSFQAAGGTDFSGGRGHIVISADASGQKGLRGPERDWDNQGWTAFANPGPGPNYLLRRGVTTINGTGTGIIPSGPLMGTAFDASGAPYQFQYADLIAKGGAQQLGPGGLALPNAISSTVNAEHLFGHLRYDLSPDVNVFLEGSYGQNHSHYNVAVPYFIATTAFTIFNDNAYLPQSVRQRMAAANVTSVPFGRIWTELGPIESAQTNTTFNLVGGLNAKLWGDWNLEIYGQHGTNKLLNTDANLPIRYNLYSAVDAVTNPATGAITCRTTLTNPNNGCVPLNLIGTHPLTAAQRSYLIGQNRSQGSIEQNVASIDAHGTLLKDWAGDVTAAAGFTYRKESANTTVDPLSTQVINCAAQGIRGCPTTINGLTGGYTNVNIQPSGGGYNVKEGYAEVLVPLARDLPFAKSLDLNGAYRYAEYSSAGDAQTWKIGTTWQPVNDIRFRGSVSRDLRAPNVGELFGGFTFGVGTILDSTKDRVNPPVAANVFEYQGSNPGLKPEIAKTKTLGVIYSPSWLSHFTGSVDYYHINIQGAIAAISAQQVVDACAGGNAGLCGQITRGAGGNITTIQATLLNLGQLETSGIDFEANYRTPLFGGDVTFRALGTFLARMTSLTPGAGAPNHLYQAGTGSNPRFQGNLQATYFARNWSMSVSERYIGTVKRETPPTTIDHNITPAAYYTSVTVRYQFAHTYGSPELYLTINNLFNQSPRITATNAGQGADYQVTSGLYDVIGRYFTVGVKARL